MEKTPPWHWLRRRLAAPAPATAKPPRDLALEGVRGLCALAVFFGHALLPSVALDPGYSPPAVLFDWFNLGFPAVMMFFILSGYVIGLTTHEPFSAPACRRYVARRCWRLMPVTYAAVLLAWLLYPATPASTVAGHALFLQNIAPYPLTGWHFPLIANNHPLWTLNYEAVYYASFVVVWWVRPPVAVVGGLLALVPVLALAGCPVSPLVARHSYGAWYWMTGLAVAWLTSAPENQATIRSRWPSAFLAGYALWTLGTLRGFLYQAGVFVFLDSEVVSLHRVDFLPAGLWVLLAVTGRAPKLERGVALACVAWGWIGVVRALVVDGATPTGLAGGGALLVGTALLGWRRPVLSLARLAPLGAISFGVYVVASPLQIAQRQNWLHFAGSGWTYLARLLLLLGLTLALAWLLDGKLQGWISRWRRRQLSCSPSRGDRQGSGDDH